MSAAQITALIDYVNAAIKAQSEAALSSSDGGLIESMQLQVAERELREAMQEPQASTAHPDVDELVQALEKAFKLIDDAADYHSARNLGEPSRILMGRLINGAAALRAALTRHRAQNGGGL